MGPRPPLACLEFPRPKNIDSSRYVCSAVNGPGLHGRPYFAAPIEATLIVLVLAWRP